MSRAPSHRPLTMAELFGQAYASVKPTRKQVRQNEKAAKKEARDTARARREARKMGAPFDMGLREIPVSNTEIPYKPVRKLKPPPKPAPPCLCGFACESYWAMLRHRKRCVTWRTREDKQALAAARRGVSFNRYHCPECGKSPNSRDGRHTPGCSYSSESVFRNELLVRNKINPATFELILKALEKRYQNRQITP